MKEENKTNAKDFNEKFLESYRKEQSDPTSKDHQFDENVNNGHVTNTSASDATQPIQTKVEVVELKLFDHPVTDFINAMLPNGVPVGSRHKCALKLAQDLMVTGDGNVEGVRQLLLQLQWVKDIVAERGQKEIDDILDAAQKLKHKRESENLNELQPEKLISKRDSKKLELRTVFAS